MSALTRRARTASLVLVLAFFILPAIAAAASRTSSQRRSPQPNRPEVASGEWQAARPENLRAPRRSSGLVTQSRSIASSERTVHVRAYTRRNRTVVHEHRRRPPSEATAIPPESGGIRFALRQTAYRKDYAAPGDALRSVARDSHGRIKRSHAAKDAFQRANPCPANGATAGGCKGYVVDHIRPLECGGADDPSNMQWQTIADGKAKDKTESYCR
jgi:hypothetical protein